MQIGELTCEALRIDRAEAGKHEKERTEVLHKVCLDNDLKNVENRTR